MSIEETLCEILRKLEGITDRQERIERTIADKISPPDDREEIPVKDASRRFGIAESTLRAYYERDLLSGTKFGKRIFINVESLRTYMRGNRKRSIRDEADAIYRDNLRTHGRIFSREGKR